MLSLSQEIAWAVAMNQVVLSESGGMEPQLSHVGRTEPWHGPLQGERGYSAWAPRVLRSAGKRSFLGLIRQGLRSSLSRVVRCVTLGWPTVAVLES